MVSRNQAGQIRRLEYGTVERVNPVVLEGQRGQIGLYGGGAAGVAGGGAVGHGVGTDLAKVGGGIVGAVTGQAVEEAVTRKDALEMFIKMDNGSIVVITQFIGMPGPSALGPVWMTKVLGLSKAQFGLMGMTWGFGTLVASFFFAYHQGLMRRGSTLCFTTLMFAVCGIVFFHSRLIPLTAVANFGLGFALIGTMVSATTIVQHTVSDAMRGRVMGLFPLAMGLSMANGAAVSAAAQAFGLELVLTSLAWATLLISGAIILWRPVLRRVNPQLEATGVPGAAAEAAGT